MNDQKNLPPIIPALSELRRIYFIGIGGIGMSALARYFQSKGIFVSGYDRTETVLTKELEESGIPIHYSDEVTLLDKEADVVVYTPAVPKEHTELNFYKDNGYVVAKRSDILGALSANSFNICVAGTHGKTTISTLIAHVLRHSNYGCNAFLGGISLNYETNFWSSTNNVCVIEADEYDRSFLKLSPDVAIITAIDADHLDIYGDEKAVQDAFIQFGGKVKKDGLLITKFGLKRMSEISGANRITYSLQNTTANVFAQNITIHNGTYQFDVALPDKTISGFHLRIGGMHNVENAVAAIAVGNYLKIGEEKLKDAIQTFKGVKRRFEYIIPPQPEQQGAYVKPILIDDYAHHPEELKALLYGVKTLFPKRKTTIIFQPHLYSRTKDFAKEFGSSLSVADTILLLPIYPARELPMEGVSSDLIFKNIQNNHKKIVTKDELLQWAQQHAPQVDKEFGEVIVTAGAGDIDTLVQPLKQIFENA